MNKLYIGETKNQTIVERFTNGVLASLLCFIFDSEVPNFSGSRPDVLCKKGVLRNFAKFKEKYLCQSLFFNKA